MTMVRIEIGRSGIHGLGCFAKEGIEAGQLVWRFDESFDLVLKKDIVEALSPGARENFLNYAFISKTTGDYILCSDDSKFTNHSSSPNVTCFVPEGCENNELECYATQDILPGEEITNDYRDFDAESDSIPMD